MQNGQPPQGVLAVLCAGPGRLRSPGEADHRGRYIRVPDAAPQAVGIAAARGVVVPVIGVDPAIALEVLGT